MGIFFLLLLFHLCTAVMAAFCKKEFFYHQHYSYGYDIYCNNLDNDSMFELTETVVYNEIRLTVEYSSFKNTSWYIAKHLPKLREINFISCNLSNLNIFKGLKKLTLLNIRNSKFDSVNYDYFKELEELQQLVLKNNSLGNSILDDFHILGGLVILNLNNNYLKGTLAPIKCTLYNVKQIYLQHNYIKELGNISCLMHMEEMYLDFNTLTNLNHLDMLVNLKVLSLSYNKIESLASLQNLPKLEVLNMEGNKLVELNEGALYNLSNLKHLNLKNNYINILLDSFFANIITLKYLNLDNNSVERIDLKYLPHIEEIHLSTNRIPSLKVFSNSTSLRRIDIASNNIKKIEQYIFSRLFNLISLNLSNNLIEDNIYDASFFGLANIEELQMENISIGYIPENSFIFSTKLQILNLSKNKMKEFGILFQKLNNLQLLNISYNRLEELRYTTINGLYNLEVIDLEGNNLRNIEYESIVTYLHKLATINIKNNTLTCEFLTKMIKFFANNHINYTINEDFNYDRENVAGIYCKETRNKLNETLKESNIALENNTALLKQLVNISKNTTTAYNKTIMKSVAYATISIILVFICLVFITYRTYVYLKRRHYCSDEFELIGRDKY